MDPDNRDRRTELLEIAATCCGDCENCGAIGYELDRLAHAGALERGPAEPPCPPSLELE